MARKKEKVAALLSMYCDSVDRNPRGPGPYLYAWTSTGRMHFHTHEAHLITLQEPNIKPIVSPTPPPIMAPILAEEISQRMLTSDSKGQIKNI